jgi:hypothetical protein
VGRKHLIGSIVALAAALLVATTAQASSEPKNQVPFTAGVAQSSSAPDWIERHTAAGVGEPKNELPFTTSAARAVLAPDWFERYAAAHLFGTDAAASISTQTPSGGFHWGDALIGAAVAGSLALLSAAAFGISRARRRQQVVHAVGA